MAAHLVSEDPLFSIYSPIILNGEVLSYRGDLAQNKILGVGPQRQHLQKLALETYPQLNKIHEISPRILPYSLADNQIDAAVLDVTKAALVPSFQFAPLSKNDFISYVVVVKNDLIETEEFQQFIGAYNKAVKKINDPQKLSEDLGMNPDFWKKTGVKFLFLD